MGKHESRHFDQNARRELVAGSIVLAQTSSTPRFRSEVDLVALDVCVTDRDGRFLPALSPDDFVVLEDRTPQQVTFFSAEGRLPLTVVVLIDRSSSMAGAKLGRATAAAVTFLRQLGPGDMAAVIDDVDAEVQHAGVPVYGISVRTDERDRSLPPLWAFGQLARNSGGRALAVHDLTTLDTVYAEIAVELHHMYRLAYVPGRAIHDGRWHSVTVRVLNQSARVRTKAGYFAPTSKPRAGERP